MAITEADIKKAVAADEDDSGGSYSFKRFITQSPSSLKSWFLTVAGTIVVVLATQGHSIDGAIVASVGLALEATLDRFYVKPKQAMQQEIQTLKALDLGMQTARRPIRAS